MKEVWQTRCEKLAARRRRKRVQRLMIVGVALITGIVTLTALYVVFPPPRTSNQSQEIEYHDRQEETRLINV